MTGKPDQPPVRPRRARHGQGHEPPRLTAAELRAAEREKERLSIELHDGVGQHLTGIAFLAKALANRLGAAGSAEAADAEQIAALTNQAISIVRSLARGLRPVGDEDNALFVAIAQLCKDVTRVYGGDCTFAADRVIAVPNPVASHHMFRIAQEAIHNAMKHGLPGGHIVVDLSERGGSITLTVTNTGRLESGGHASSRDSPGIGIMSMRYRANLIGAKLSLENHRDRDVRLKLVINREAAHRVREEGEAR